MFSIFERVRIGKWILRCLLFAFVLICLGGCMMNNKKLTELVTYGADQFFFSNPQNVSQIGDPFVMRASDGKYYCYATSDSNGFKVWWSEDMIHWTKEVMNAYTKTRTTWGKSDFWAPEVYEWDGRFYMFYTARWKENNSLRIGLAVSDSPLGPFIDVEDRPLFDFGYAAIDANVFVDDDGAAYLYYSRDCSENVIDGNNESHIYGIALSEDRMQVQGEAVELLRPEQSWETPPGNWRWNEGPYVLKQDRSYYLMYSGNVFSSSSYSLGYAMSDSPLGIYKKSEDNPILYTQNDWKDISGPGHHSVVASPAGTTLYVAYHTHSVPAIGGGNRQLNLDVMGFREDGSLFINGPSLTAQLLPSYMDKAKACMGKIKLEKDSPLLPLFDGEIALHTDGRNLAKQVELVNADPIHIEFETPQSITTILLYSGIELDTKVNVLSKVRVEFSNGMVISELSFDQDSLDAASVSFDPMEIEWIKIYNISDMKSGSLSEVIVF